MTEEQIYQKIEKIYNSEKGKGFITHLLRSFFPVGKGTFIWDTNEMEEPKCCITGKKLIGKSEAMGAMLKTTPEEFSKHLRVSLDLGGDEEEKKKYMEHPAKKHLPKGAVLGIECEKSDKLLCQDAYEQLYNFYATKLLHGDKHMNWLAKNMRAKETIKLMKENGVDITQTEEKTVIKKINKPQKTTFGDLEVLQNLKNKLEQNNT